MAQVMAGGTLRNPLVSIILGRTAQFRAPDTELENSGIFSNLEKFLTFKDLMTARQVSHNWNETVINCSRKAQHGLKGKISEKFYAEAARLNAFDQNCTPTWSTFEFSHFGFRRNSGLFKNYWHNVTMGLKTLSISNCSLECDGFIFLLDQCPVLETLNLKECKLRDLDDFHNTQGGHPRMRTPNPVAHPITVPLRHLSIESISIIEQCFMDYLIRRTGQLESINISKCFILSQKAIAAAAAAGVPEQVYLGPDPLARFHEFERNLVHLIQANTNTLRKYGFHENNYQTDFFGRMAERPQIRIPEFSLSLLSDQQTGYANVIRFMNNSIGLQNFTLEFKGTLVNSTPIENMLNGHRPTLQKFKLIVNGRLIGHRSNMGNTPIQLHFLQNFEQLESFHLEDSKELVNSKIVPHIGGRRFIRKKLSLNDINETLRKAATNVDADFVGHLPDGLRRLSLTKYMAPSNFIQTVPAMNRALDLFSGLTKLELRGPWVYAIDGVVGTISTELRNLETLALTAFGIDDSHLTDLSTQAVDDMRKCLTFGLELFTLPNSPSRQTVVSAVQAAMRENTNLPRRRLSDIPNLKHLDLSKNHKISDVSLFDGLSIPQMKTLVLDGCALVTDAGLDLIQMNFPVLEELNLKNCRKLTRFGLNRLVTHCPTLKKVFTTKTIQTRELVGIEFPMNPNYNDILSIDIVPEVGGFEDDE